MSSEQVAALSAVGRAAPRGYFDCGLPRRFATYRLVDPRGTVKPVELSPCQSPGINAMIAWLENRVDLREPGIEPADADIGAVPRAVLVEGERLVVTGPGSTGCPFDVEGIRRRRRTLVVEPVRHDACRTDFRPGTVEIDPSELDLDEVDEVRLAGSAAFDSGPFIRYDPQMVD